MQWKNFVVSGDSSTAVAGNCAQAEILFSQKDHAALVFP